MELLIKKNVSFILSLRYKIIGWISEAGLKEYFNLIII